MATKAPKTDVPTPPGLDAAWNYSLMEAIFKRRTRRIAFGAEIPGGPTQYRSERDPFPLSELEEALLIQAATGVSGFNLSDLPFCDEQGRDMGGNTMIQFAGRTWPSPCASHDTELFFWNDSGTYVMKLHDVAPERMHSYETADDRSRVLELHRKGAVKLSDGRPDYPHTYPTMLPFNIPTSDVPGSTIFLPIADTTFELINVLLLMCGWPDGGMAVVDPENGNQPAGCERWIKEGLLNPMFSVPLTYFGNVSQIESGFMIQNLLLSRRWGSEAGCTRTLPGRCCWAARPWQRAWAFASSPARAARPRGSRARWGWTASSRRTVRPTTRTWTRRSTRSSTGSSRPVGCTIPKASPPAPSSSTTRWCAGSRATATRWCSA
jgi:hypothetical protein